MEVVYIKNKAVFNGHVFNRDKSTGYYVSSRRIGRRRVRLHRYVWETMTGCAIPEGFEIHHKDRNKDNNAIDNLMLIKSEEHRRLHGQMLTEEQRKTRAENLINKALPEAIKWHGSEEGRSWHSKHAKRLFQIKIPHKYTCSFCLKEFNTKHDYGAEQNTFCSNKCKAAFRRASGVDNVIKVCEACGGEYVANKYQKTKYCEGCKHRNGRNRAGV